MISLCCLLLQFFAVVSAGNFTLKFNKDRFSRFHQRMCCLLNQIDFMIFMEVCHIVDLFNDFLHISN